MWCTNLFPGHCLHNNVIRNVYGINIILHYIITLLHYYIITFLHYSIIPLLPIIFENLNII